MSDAVKSDAAISFRGATKRFGARTVVEALDLDIPRGQTTVLLGPSGTGKSTLLRMATGLLRPDDGSVEVLGQDVFSLSRAGLLQLRRRMGMLFQDNALFGSLSVVDNVAFPLVRVGKQPAQQARARAEELLALVGLVDVGRRLPDALSGGQKKRVAFARAIALEPELVLFDEPTSGLDPQTSAAIDDLVMRLQARLAATFVVITHDVVSAGAIAHNAGFLLDGKLRAWGSRDAVWGSSDPAVRAFLDRAPRS
ncbi:MAG TPA: ATP-binding cassette domain-containing protein [Myxococcota bacterium]